MIEKRRPKKQHEELDLLLGLCLTLDQTGKEIAELHAYPGQTRDVNPLLLAKQKQITFLAGEISDLYDSLALKLSHLGK